MKSGCTSESKDGGGWNAEGTRLHALPLKWTMRYISSFWETKYNFKTRTPRKVGGVEATTEARKIPSSKGGSFVGYWRWRQEMGLIDTHWQACNMLCRNFDWTLYRDMGHEESKSMLWLPLNNQFHCQNHCAERCELVLPFWKWSLLL